MLSFWGFFQKRVLTFGLFIYQLIYFCLGQINDQPVKSDDLIISGIYQCTENSPVSYNTTVLLLSPIYSSGIIFFLPEKLCFYQ